ncbi:type II secretion system minor pseudopilin GspK [Psychromonas sp. PT13]|uniref:type II secretion system minor pseudopilin GspK n=1 Tax=Psychromonas sp. PT13 TaxID=3439547 RepID=UPI003EC05BA3
MLNRKPQKGFALVTVLMILAIMVTVAATMTGRLTLSLKRTEGITFSQKVYWYGQAAAELGRMVLDEDFADSDVVSLDQIWATPDMIFPLDNGHIAGEIKDLRSCFNVNAVIDETSEAQFETLLNTLDIEDYSAETVAQSTLDWVDDDDESDSSQGAEDSYYEGLKVPHLTANASMTDLTELRAVQGVTKDVYEQIKPYLCAVPSIEQAINVNTIKVDQAEILYAIFNDEDLTVDDFTALLEERPTSGWSDVDEFLDSSLFDDITVESAVKSQLAVTSEFFEFDGIAEFEDRIQVFKFLFYIESEKASVIRYQSGGV